MRFIRMALTAFALVLERLTRDQIKISAVVLCALPVVDAHKSKWEHACPLDFCKCDWEREGITMPKATILTIFIQHTIGTKSGRNEAKILLRCRLFTWSFVKAAQPRTNPGMLRPIHQKGCPTYFSRWLSCCVVPANADCCVSLRSIETFGNGLIDLLRHHGSRIPPSQYP